MQPPETEPAIRPDLDTAIWLPAGRGELPHVSVTVATATCSPAARQAAAVPRISSVVLIVCFPSYSQGGRRGPGQQIDQAAQAGQIMHRTKLVHVRQHRL